MTEIKRMDVVSHIEPLSAGLTALYRTAFDEIDTLAAQRHMLTGPELNEIWQNPRVQKWIAFEGTTPTGVATITNSLPDWPLVSPRYFARHFPEHHAAAKIWYIGFVGVLPGRNLFADLITSMAPQVVLDGGMAVMDFAHYNVAVRKIDRVTDALLRRYTNTATGGQLRAVHQPLDSQHFHAWSFCHDA